MACVVPTDLLTNFHFYFIIYFYTKYRSPTESRKRHEQKQAKARQLREKLMQEKAERLKEISKKVHHSCILSM